MFLGIDIGTSGCRACVVDKNANVIAWESVPLPAPIRAHPGFSEQSPQIWWQALDTLLTTLSKSVPLNEVLAIALDGTSGSVLLTDTNGNPVTNALMYNDSRSQPEADRIKTVAPSESGGHGASSGLAKWLHLRQSKNGQIQTQADWILGKFSGNFQYSDENNALKLGYDPILRRWPGWMSSLGFIESEFPVVLIPGEIRGDIDLNIAKRYGFSQNTKILAGTTDSIAAVLATEAQLGDAVTSLGSTLVLKVISDKPVFAPEKGVYSHRLKDHWLVGGASNTGGAVLKKLFTDHQIENFSVQLNPAQVTGLHYYPLPAVGERFPTNDPNLEPLLTPKPDDEAVFFQGILESIAEIEAAGYRLLKNLGCPYPNRIISAGGGANNAAWRQIREQKLGVPVLASETTEAAYGMAKLAYQTLLQQG